MEPPSSPQSFRCAPGLPLCLKNSTDRLITSLGRRQVEHIVIVQADQSSGVLNDFSVQTISLAPAAACGASFNLSSAEAVADGAIGTVSISAPSSCCFGTKMPAPWLSLRRSTPPRLLRRVTVWPDESGSRCTHERRLCTSENHLWKRFSFRSGYFWIAAKWGTRVGSNRTSRDAGAVRKDLCGNWRQRRYRPRDRQPERHRS